MDTFPFESWDDALASAAEGDGAYFTFGVGTGLTILTILGIALCVAVIIYLVTNEARHLNSAAARLADKYARH